MRPRWSETLRTRQRRLRVRRARPLRPGLRVLALLMGTLARGRRIAAGCSLFRLRAPQRYY